MHNEKLALYDKLIAKCDLFKRKGKTMPHTSVNGYMFSAFNKNDEIGIRFSKEVQKEYLIKYNTTYFKSYNAIMKGYILITDEMLEDEENVINLLKESYKYYMS